MAYNDDITWNELASMAQRESRALIQQLHNAMIAYNKYQSFAAGRNDSQLATALSKTSAQVGELRAAFGALKEIYDFANNEASPSQGDRFYSLRKFS